MITIINAIYKYCFKNKTLYNKLQIIISLALFFFKYKLHSNIILKH